MNSYSAYWAQGNYKPRQQQQTFMSTGGGYNTGDAGFQKGEWENVPKFPNTSKTPPYNPTPGYPGMPPMGGNQAPPDNAPVVPPLPEMSRIDPNGGVHPGYYPTPSAGDMQYRPGRHSYMPFMGSWQKYLRQYRAMPKPSMGLY